MKWIRNKIFIPLAKNLGPSGMNFMAKFGNSIGKVIEFVNENVLKNDSGAIMTAIKSLLPGGPIVDQILKFAVKFIDNNDLSVLGDCVVNLISGSSPEDELNRLKRRSALISYKPTNTYLQKALPAVSQNSLPAVSQNSSFNVPLLPQSTKGFSLNEVSSDDYTDSDEDYFPPSQYNRPNYIMKPDKLFGSKIN